MISQTPELYSSYTLLSKSLFLALHEKIKAFVFAGKKEEKKRKSGFKSWIQVKYFTDFILVPLQ